MFKQGWLFLLAAWSLSGVVFAVEPETIGFVKVAEGEAWLAQDGKIALAHPGLAVHLGDILKTGRQGAMGVTFKDNTIMSIGPNTEVQVEEYLYAPGKDQLKLRANMLRGTLHYLSGLIAKLRPENVSVKTPTGIIGVRGTRFLVKVEGERE